MLNPLTTQSLIQTPGYHLISFEKGCISGCVSGISPVLELDHRVLVDNKNIIQQSKALLCKVFGLLFVFFANIIGG